MSGMSGTEHILIFARMGLENSRASISGSEAFLGLEWQCLARRASYKAGTGNETNWKPRLTREGQYLLILSEHFIKASQPCSCR